MAKRSGCGAEVAPFAGAWIEIQRQAHTQSLKRSLRSPERGLKFYQQTGGSGILKVAPFAGAWIEIVMNDESWSTERVAPFAGAWIEITIAGAINTALSGRSVRRSVD